MGWRPNPGYEGYQGPVEIRPYQPSSGAGAALFKFLTVATILVGGGIAALYLTGSQIERAEMRGWLGAGVCLGPIVLVLMVGAVALFRQLNEKDIEHANEMTRLRIEASERQRLQLPPIIVQQPASQQQQWQPPFDPLEMYRQQVPPGGNGQGYRIIGEQ